MYQHGNYFFIAHPKTGSTSVAAALNTVPWATHGGHHYMDDRLVRKGILEGGAVFSTMRNMFEVVRSWWYTLAVGPQGQRLGDWEDFEDFVFWLCFKSNITWLQSPLYHYGLPFTTVRVRFEEAPRFYREKFGVEIPWLKRSLCSFHYREMFTPQAREWVEMRYREDLELTGYEY